MYKPLHGSVTCRGLYRAQWGVTRDAVVMGASLTDNTSIYADRGFLTNTHGIFNIFNDMNDFSRFIVYLLF